ncbi:MAG: hypothetical protein ISS82_05815 [Nanoarchaeota archaeon]|nr:hypothetical protein [Nanoarchaeota archaeon]
MTNFTKDLKNLVLNELLELFKNSSGNVKDKIIQIIKEKLSLQKPLISISKEETRTFYEITKTQIYAEMENCLGSHWSMNLIALGLYVAQLNKDQKTELQKRVSQEVHLRYGVKGLRILEIGSTGAIINIIRYISDIKVRQNYTFIEIGKLFDKILEEWQNITIFVKSEETINNIEIKIMNFISLKKPLFFIFAYGSAVNNTISTIAKLNNDDTFRSNGYIFYANTQYIGDDINKKEAYSCYFENIKGYGINLFI